MDRPLRVTMTVEPDQGATTRFSPGLNWNEHTEAVFEAQERFRDAIRACQSAEHLPEGPKEA